MLLFLALSFRDNQAKLLGLFTRAKNHSLERNFTLYRLDRLIFTDSSTPAFSFPTKVFKDLALRELLHAFEGLFSTQI